MDDIPGVDQKIYLGMKAKEFRQEVRSEASSSYDTWDREWDYATITKKQSEELLADIDHIDTEVREGRMEFDEAYAALNTAKEKLSDFNDKPNVPLPSDPTEIAVDYYHEKSSEIYNATMGNKFPSTPGEKGYTDMEADNLWEASRGIRDGLKKGEITLEEAASLSKELDEHTKNLKNFNDRANLSAEDEAQRNAIHDKLNNMQKQCGHSPETHPYEPNGSRDYGFDEGESQNTTGSSPSGKSGPDPKDDKSESSQTGTIAILAVLAVLALILSVLFFPFAPIILGAACVTAIGIVGARHGIDTLFAPEADNNAPGAGNNESRAAAANTEPEADNNELEADDEALETANNKPEADDEALETANNKPEADDEALETAKAPPVQNTDRSERKPIAKQGLPGEARSQLTDSLGSELPDQKKRPNQPASKADNNKTLGM